MASAEDQVGTKVGVESDSSVGAEHLYPGLDEINTKVLSAVDPNTLLSRASTFLVEVREREEDSGPISTIRPATQLDAKIRNWERDKGCEYEDNSAIEVLVTISNIQLEQLALESALVHALAAFKLQAQTPKKLTKDLCGAIIHCYSSILGDKYHVFDPGQKEQYKTAQDLFINLYRHLNPQQNHPALALRQAAANARQSILSIHPDSKSQNG